MINVHDATSGELVHIDKHVNSVKTLAGRIRETESALNKAGWFYLAPGEDPIDNKEWERLARKCRPCPFCGGNSLFAFDGTLDIEQYRTFTWTGKEWWEINDRHLWRVACGCGARGPHMGSPELAVSAWNGRGLGR